MGNVLAFRPRPHDREIKVVLPSIANDHTERLHPSGLTGLDNLLHGSPWEPGMKRPKGTLVIDLEGSGIRFVLKIVTQAEHDVKPLVSYQMAKANEFPRLYGQWTVDGKILSPTGFIEFMYLNQELISRQWVPANHYEPTSGLGIIFGYRKDVHNILIVQVEYNPFYHKHK